PGAWVHVWPRGARARRAARLFQHARPIAGLDAPGETARDPLRRDFRGEAPELAILLALDGIQREPRGGAGAVVRTGPGLAVEPEAGEDFVADVEAECVARAARGAHEDFGVDRRRAGAALRHARDAGQRGGGA